MNMGYNCHCELSFQNKKKKSFVKQIIKSKKCQFFKKWFEIEQEKLRGFIVLPIFWYCFEDNIILYQYLVLFYKRDVANDTNGQDRLPN